MVDFHGHCFNYANSVCRAASSKNIDFKILTSDACIPEVKSAVKSVSVFSPPQRYLYRSRWKTLLYMPLTFNRYIYKGLTSSDLRFLDPNWIVFIGTADHNYLLGLYMWIKRFNPKNAPAFVLTLRLGYFRVGLNRWSPYALWFMLFIRLIEKLAKRYRILLVTDSKRLKTDFKRFTQLPIHVIPIPHNDITQLQANTFKNNEKITMISLGPARVPKGFHTLAQAIQLLHQQGEMRNLSFNLHIFHEAAVGKIIPEAIKDLKLLKLPNIHFVEQHLGELEYYQMLKDSDVSLIPYSPDMYYANTSGTFTESLAAGKPVIVTEGTWMSEQLKQYGAGITCKYNDPKDLARAIMEMRDNYHMLAEQAMAKRKSWISYHNPEMFLSEIIGLVSAVGKG